MRRYTRLSGLFFALLAGVQLLRVILQWPVYVGDMSIPLWASMIAALVAGLFAIWAYRVRRRLVR